MWELNQTCHPSVFMVFECKNVKLQVKNKADYVKFVTVFWCYCVKDTIFALDY